MQARTRSLLAVAMLVAGIGVCANSPDASSPHLVVLNDTTDTGTNAGTVFNLTPRPDPKLTLATTLATGGLPGELGLPGAAMLQHGGDTCIYLVDGGTADVAAFVYPSFVETGRYTVPGVTNAGFGMGIVARGNFLFANYSSQQSPGFFIATWNIQNGCGLTLGPIYDDQEDVSGMAISPDGKTLAVGYDYPSPSLASFSVGSDGSLTEHGPYGGPFSFPTGVDITADGKYAIYGEFNGDVGAQMQIGIYAINSDGSFGVFNTFVLGPVANAQYVRLSPDEKFLFVSVSGRGSPVVTLNFDESIPQLTYTGCTKNVKGSPGGMATAFPTGAGGFLYLAEAIPTAGVALFEINPSTGCLQQVSGSPFSSGKKGGASSVAAWPPRPF